MPSKRCHKCRVDIPDAEWKRHQRAHHDRKMRDDGYRSREWKRTSQALLQVYPVCQRCRERASYLAHHKHGLRPADPGGMDPANLLVVCDTCHKQIHAGHPVVA
jgi:hypothetical protein